MSQRQQRKQLWDNRKRAKSYNKRQKCCKLILQSYLFVLSLTNILEYHLRKRLNFQRM